MRIHCIPGLGTKGLLVLLCAGAVASSHAQSIDPTNLLPVVSIEAIDPQASEPGLLTVIENGVFRITRDGPTNHALTVAYSIGGSASNGVDYAALSDQVLIPAGVAAVDIVIQPLHDLLPEGTETVVLRLKNPVFITIYPPPPGAYLVGSGREAVVFIADNDTPLPVVTIVARDPIASEGTNCCRWVGWTSTATATFCGTNTALFVVRRQGPTNEALTVCYGVGGMASNGVDYVELPGVVTVPTGQRAASILVVPFDDALPEPVESVVLRLHVPPTVGSAVPPYVIGCPGQAAAIIVDNDGPRPCTGMLPDRCFHLSTPGTDGAWFRIESSTDLRQWTPLCSNAVTNGAIHFVDPDADEAPARFYRAVPEAVPPPE